MASLTQLFPSIRLAVGFTAYRGHMVHLASLILAQPRQNVRSEEEQREDREATHAGPHQAAKIEIQRPWCDENKSWY